MVCVYLCICVSMCMYIAIFEHFVDAFNPIVEKNGTWLVRVCLRLSHEKLSSPFNLFQVVVV